MTIRPFLATGFCIAAIWLSPATAQPVEPFSAFTDCQACPEMIALPAGTFMMGATEADGRMPWSAGVSPYELPRHEVTIGYGFALGATEVTVGQFRAFVEATGTMTGGRCGIRSPDSGPHAGAFEGTPDPQAVRYPGVNYVQILDGAFDQPGLPFTEDHPATCVSLAEARAYLAWLSEVTGRAYRLPTEAEWEYAARAGTETVWPWGDDPDGSCAHANTADTGAPYQGMAGASCREEQEHLWASPAASYQPNPWGFYDLIGNVQEFLLDCWHDNYSGAPADGSPWLEDDCEWLVARGGDYEHPAGVPRVAERLFYGQENGEFGRANLLGFRVAVSLDAAAWDR